MGKMKTSEEVIKMFDKCCKRLVEYRTTNGTANDHVMVEVKYDDYEVEEWDDYKGVHHRERSLRPLGFNAFNHGVKYRTRSGEVKEVEASWDYLFDLSLRGFYIDKISVKYAKYPATFTIHLDCDEEGMDTNIYAEVIDKLDEMSKSLVEVKNAEDNDKKLEAKSIQHCRNYLNDVRCYWDIHEILAWNQHIVIDVDDEKSGIGYGKKGLDNLLAKIEELKTTHYCSGYRIAHKHGSLIVRFTTIKYGNKTNIFDTVLAKMIDEVEKEAA